MVLYWANLFSLVFFSILCWFFYIQSAMPSIRAERYGAKAWDDCKRFRIIATLCMMIFLSNMILWLWIPVPALNWVMHPNPIIPIVLGSVVAIPFTLILIKGLIDAGRETFLPDQQTVLYGGIYKYIRHPQILGRIPLTLVLTMWLNSLFLFIFATIFLVILIPTLIHFEEKDLINRFGDSYIKYRDTTGAIFPKIRKSSNQSM